jgi:hypothetical protein
MNFLRTPNGQRRKIRFARILFAIPLLATTLGCQSGDGKTAPDNIIGVWKTSDSKYAGRYIEIKNDTIIFGTGGDTFQLHAIADVDASHERNSTLYTISHINHHGQRYEFAFYYDPDNNGMMRLKNRRHIIWTRGKP